MRREVDSLSILIACTRNKNEPADQFENRFSGAVARFANLTILLTPSPSRKFAILLLRNAVLSSDTLNAVIYQLTNRHQEGVSDGAPTNIAVTKHEAEVIGSLKGYEKPEEQTKIVAGSLERK